MKQFILPVDYKGEQHLRLENNTFHHLAHVLRVRPGDSLKGISQHNQRYTFRVRSIESRSCIMERISSEEPFRKPHHITLFQGLLKGKKLDQVVRQSTEAGVDRIIPVITEYSVPRPENRKEKGERLRKIVREAVEQSGSPTIPDVIAPISIDDIPDHWNGDGMALYCHNTPDRHLPLHRYLDISAGENIALCIGPEGGLSDSDILILQEAGFQPLYLGGNTLRSETATVFILGALNIILMEKETWTLKNRS